jgi:hypothetical protein
VVDVPLLVGVLAAKFSLTREEAQALIPFRTESAPQSSNFDAASVAPESTPTTDSSTVGHTNAEEPTNSAGK